ncbi:MAG: hypothetical protein ACK4K9_11640 [Bacteroidia bacterium]
MNSKKLKQLSIAVIPFLMTSCATIFGGSRYIAHIVVADRPNAKIVYKGEIKGTGSASIKVNRNEANRFSFIVKEDGCQEQKFDYTSRTFRGWAFVGTIVGWTGISSGIPIPWGVIVDLATGAVWKPNTMENGISKDDYKNFRYLVNYTNCSISKTETNQQLVDVLYLKNGSVIRGTIIEQVPNVQIKIQTKDGNIFVYKIEEIERITKEYSK